MAIQTPKRYSPHYRDPPERHPKSLNPKPINLENPRSAASLGNSSLGLDPQASKLRRRRKRRPAMLILGGFPKVGFIGVILG